MSDCECDILDPRPCHCAKARKARRRYIEVTTPAACFCCGVSAAHTVTLPSALDMTVLTVTVCDGHLPDTMRIKRVREDARARLEAALMVGGCK